MHHYRRHQRPTTSPLQWRRTTAVITTALVVAAIPLSLRLLTTGPADAATVHRLTGPVTISQASTAAPSTATPDRPSIRQRTKQRSKAAVEPSWATRLRASELTSPSRLSSSKLGTAPSATHKHRTPAGNTARPKAPTTTSVRPKSPATATTTPRVTTPAKTKTPTTSATPTKTPVTSTTKPAATTTRPPAAAAQPKPTTPSTTASKTPAASSPKPPATTPTSSVTTTPKPSTTTPPASTPPAQDSGKTLINAQFEKQATGPVVPKNFAAEMGDVSTWAPAYKDMSIIADGSGGQALRVTLDKGTIHSKPDGEHGVVLFARLSEQVDSACVSYRIRFDADFDWSLGGKLPGLSGVAPGVNPGAPTGGNPTSEGWSGRMMWLGAGSYSWVKGANMAVSYMYHPDQAGQYGDDLPWNKAFVPGRWHEVKQCYTMNSIGKKDGQLHAWFDGQLVVNDNAFVYRTRSDVHINYLTWSVFRGGSTLDWAGSRTGYIDFDDVRVTVS